MTGWSPASLSPLALILSLILRLSQGSALAAVVVVAGCMRQSLEGASEEAEARQDDEDIGFLGGTRLLSLSILLLLLLPPSTSLP